MKNSWIALLLVAAMSLGLCVASTSIIRQTVEEMDRRRLGVLEALECGDPEEAFSQLSEMAARWQAREPHLEMLAFHDLLHEISELMIEADANLTIGDTDDFYRSMALLGEALSHLLQDERLTLSNIL